MKKLKLLICLLVPIIVNARFDKHEKSKRAVVQSGCNMQKLYIATAIPFIMPLANPLPDDTTKKKQMSKTLYELHSEAFRQVLRPYDSAQTVLNNWYKSLTEKEQSLSENIDKMEDASNRIVKERKNALRVFLTGHNNSPVALDVVQFYGGKSPKYEEVYPVFILLSDSIQKSEMGQRYIALLRKYQNLEIGKVAPTFMQTDTSGKKVALEDFRGKYVLIDFWASWCGPCRHENPNVVQAYKLYKDKGFSIIGISLDNPSGKNAWLNAIQKDQLQWTQVSDLQGWKNEVAILYGVRSIPTNYLLDPTGRIVAKNLRGEELNKVLKNLLEKK